MKSAHCRAIARGLACLSLGSAVAHGASRIHPGTLAWAEAARSGRADLLILGDSIVSNGTGGFANGIARAAQSGIGLAGSGLLTAPGDLPSIWSGYTGARLWSGPASDAVVDGGQFLTPSGRYYDAKADFTFVGAGYDPVSIDRTAAIDWHVFAAGDTPTAQLQAVRMRRTLTPNTVTSMQVSAVTPVGRETDGLDEYVFHFDSSSNPGDWNSFQFTGNSRDVDLYYTKLTNPGAAGITVTSWSRSGGTTRRFREEYNTPVFTDAGRGAFYDALVAGSSGYLNVMITFGVNDAPAYGPEVYREQIRGMVADVRRDWTLAGHDPDMLSFTLMSTYQINPNTYFTPAAYPTLLQDRLVLEEIAATDPKISFLDLWEAGPTYAQASALGYLSDGVHPNAAGTAAYGELIAHQLTPTPGDSNFDGDVDFNDLLVLAQFYGRTDAVYWQTGNFNGVGGVTFDDLLALAQNYGLNFEQTVGSFESDWALARSIVPEPTVGSAAVFLLARRRRR